MRKNLAGKTALIVATLLVFFFGIFGIPKGVSPQAWKSALTSRIHLGLDLKGGTHLVLQVMVDEAVSAVTDNDVVRLQTDLQGAGLTAQSVFKPDAKQPAVIQVQGTPADRTGDVRSLLDSRYGNQYTVSAGSNNSWMLTMKPSEVQTIEQHALQQAIETIRARVDSLGVSEPTIQEYNLGSNQILVELPGVDDISTVRDVIQSTARLEIHQVVSGPFSSEQEATQSLGGTVPPEDVVMAYGGTEPDLAGKYYVLQRLAVVAGSDFRDAQPSVDENGRPDATFILTTNAGDRFYQFTSSNIGKSLAVVLDNRVQEAATIQQAIRDSGRITGLGKEKAENLSLMLRTGALPASIHYLQESVVGPSLGADSIRKGVLASVIGMAAVMIFMLVYYHGAGINADLALFLNLIILLGFMGFSGATLTLPGIAGVILTIGMGVDSNVLIFERIREELRAGKAPGAAVEQGFAHAWTTILDTHVTTIVSALILFLFGTGPVKGFAVTLSVGLAANLFTAVFVSRVIFDSILKRKQRGEALSIG
ncbi:MAG TPA: protein translocase subunit SecD [Acidobacteriaceae bacterium]|nr:protein translocase subunit SecD [Acidobacteriaceae bacterium]